MFWCLTRRAMTSYGTAGSVCWLPAACAGLSEDAAPVPVSQIRSGSCSASQFIPMWAGLPLDSHAHADDQRFRAFEASGPSPKMRPFQLQFKLMIPARLDAELQAAIAGLVQAGGIATSTQVTGQQWDGDNAWPPIQVQWPCDGQLVAHMLVMLAEMF